MSIISFKVWIQNKIAQFVVLRKKNLVRTRRIGNLIYEYYEYKGHHLRLTKRVIPQVIEINKTALFIIFAGGLFLILLSMNYFSLTKQNVNLFETLANLGSLLVTLSVTVFLFIRGQEIKFKEYKKK